MKIDGNYQEKGKRKIYENNKNGLNNTLDAQQIDFNLELYSDWIDIEIIKKNAKVLKGLKVLHVNSVSRGGGVAAILSKLVPAFNSLGIKTHWYVPELGNERFFNITKKQHNMLQGQDTSNLTREEKKLYLETQKKLVEMIGDRINAYDIVVVHDTQYLGLIEAKKNAKTCYIYRCHIDTSTPNDFIVDFFKDSIGKYDATVYHKTQFILPGSPRPFVIPPSIDPLEKKNLLSAVDKEAIREAITSFSLDPERPVLLQVGRFDPAKGYERVCEVFKRLKPDYPEIQLLLTGAGAKDDPQFEPYLKKIKSLVQGIPDTAVAAMPFDVIKLNAVQQGATIVYAMSTREGFGLVVAEASIKKKPVIVSNAGGLPEQVIDKKTGFVVNSIDEAVEKTSLLLDNPGLRREMGEAGRKYIFSRFITPIHLNNYLKMFLSII